MELPELPPEVSGDPAELPLPEAPELPLPEAPELVPLPEEPLPLAPPQEPPEPLGAAPELDEPVPEVECFRLWCFFFAGAEPVVLDRSLEPVPDIEPGDPVPDEPA